MSYQSNSYGFGKLTRDQMIRVGLSARRATMAQSLSFRLKGVSTMDDEIDAEVERIMSMPEHELAAELAKEGKTIAGVAADIRKITERAIAEVARRRIADPRLYIAIRLWHRFAPAGHVDWEEEPYKAEYLSAIDGIETGDLFNLLLRRIDFDGADPRTLSLSELQRAIKGAEFH